MANYIGAVRFKDGALLYFSYQGTTDIARRMLFNDPDSVTIEQNVEPTLSNAEPVEVMPYFCHGNRDVMFTSLASRLHMQITGPRSLDEVTDRERQQRSSPY